MTASSPPAPPNGREPRGIRVVEIDGTRGVASVADEVADHFSAVVDGSSSDRW